jgi:hypothetical protein
LKLVKLDKSALQTYLMFLVPACTFMRRCRTALNLKLPKVSTGVVVMSRDNVLVAITASREKGEIVYRVECSSDLTNEEFEYYLGEIISGICTWKNDICEKNIRSFKGKIKEKKK